ncbi:hypothetical protein H6G74_14590 [Nostoc spongiaeforme FACHB-130]|uniref:SPOR domain-containing protein n=1 Tax=Nostoc spongiaeforme FACHB-130 TaxID=1357510 RepID=A0ABR8FWS8_9NOSO|nr:hypothetical protein [Nostoc spongiaeforme]MBD2595548.1 hypothetical protein [Nostoc spongiaeforme FACHB-130]
MSQNSPIDSGIQLSKTPELKPALAAALASLEVQLDQELARYRRSRIAAKTAYQAQTGSNVNTQLQNTTAITALTGKTQLPVTEVKTSIPSAPVTEVSIEKPVTVAKTETTTPPQPTSSPDSQQTQIPLPSPHATSSIVPAAFKTTESENLMSTKETPTQPDDYLESSEALLRSLNDEQPQPTKPPSNSQDSLLSPLGIGSMLLLLMASLTLGYVVFNPKSLPQLSFDKIFNSNSATNTNPTQTQPAASQSQPPEQTELTPIPKYPNLAAKEFPELKDPNDIVGLQPKTPPNAAAPVNPPVVIAPPAVNPLPEVQPVQPLNVSPIPTTQPLVTTPQVNSEIKPAADGFYHIVMDNEGDRSFATAKQIVPDAYLSGDNKLIHLAALKTKEQVAQRLQELQAKGIKARVQ